MLALYRGAARLAHRMPVRRGAAAESIAGRRAARSRWQAWAARDRTDTPLVWFHAASVGESQAAASIMMRLRAAAHPVQLILTYSSPSMARWPGTWPADRTDYVPLDEPGPLAAVFDAVRPDVLCFSRGDLWPELVATARARSVPVAVVGGTVRVGSRRHRWPGRFVLREMHRSLTHVGAVSAADRERWIAAGVPPDTIVVTGDPRHDWILEREARVGPVRALRTWRGGHPVVVAGSVERDDVAPLTTGLRAVYKTIPDIRMVAVPHDPAGAHVVLESVQGAGFTAATWDGSCAPAATATVLVVTAAGLLADLYLAGDVAYVGGGFRRGRLHATAEPAAFALPLLVGPWAAGPCGATVLPRERAGESLGSMIRSWMEAPGDARRAGLAARRCLVAGAARREARTVLELIRSR